MDNIQRKKLIDYYIRGGNAKAILEDEDGFDNVTSADVEKELERIANSVLALIEDEAVDKTPDGNPTGLGRTGDDSFGSMHLWNDIDNFGMY